MRPIDADELRQRVARVGYVNVLRHIDAAPTVDVPQPLTRDGVLAAVKAIEAAGGKAVVEELIASCGGWERITPGQLNLWRKPDVPRWNVRVRAVEVETEDVPLTQLVGRTIKGCDQAVFRQPLYNHLTEAWAWAGTESDDYRPFPDGTLDLATARVTVVKGEA